MVNERLQRQIDRLLDEAEHAVGQKDWVGVIERVEHVLTLDPDNGDAVALRRGRARTWILLD